MEVEVVNWGQYVFRLRVTVRITALYKVGREDGGRRRPQCAGRVSNLESTIGLPAWYQERPRPAKTLRMVYAWASDTPPHLSPLLLISPCHPCHPPFLLFFTLSPTFQLFSFFLVAKPRRMRLVSSMMYTCIRVMGFYWKGNFFFIITCFGNFPFFFFEGESILILYLCLCECRMRIIRTKSSLSFFKRNVRFSIVFIIFGAFKIDSLNEILRFRMGMLRLVS